MCRRCRRIYQRAQTTRSDPHHVCPQRTHAKPNPSLNQPIPLQKSPAKRHKRSTHRRPTQTSLCTPHIPNRDALTSGNIHAQAWLVKRKPQQHPTTTRTPLWKATPSQGHTRQGVPREASSEARSRPAGASRSGPERKRLLTEVVAGELDELCRGLAGFVDAGLSYQHGLPRSLDHRRGR
jgi:hypothetical protein